MGIRLPLLPGRYFLWLSLSSRELKRLVGLQMLKFSVGQDKISEVIFDWDMLGSPQLAIDATGNVWQ